MAGKKKASKKTTSRTAPTPPAQSDEKPRKPRAPKVHFELVQVFAVFADGNDGSTAIDILEDKEGARLCAKSYTDNKGTKTFIEERDALVITTTKSGRPPEITREFYVLDPDFEQPTSPGASDFSRLAALRSAAMSKLTPDELLALGIQPTISAEQAAEPEATEPKRPPARGTADSPADPTDSADDDDVFDDEDDEDEDDDDENDGAEDGGAEDGGAEDDDEEDDPFAEA